MNYPKEIRINEMVLRDGLQLEEKVLSVEEKHSIYDSLKKAGIQSFEFGSFVHPKLVPQMANSGELFTEIAQDAEGIELIALVPNLKGAQKAQELQVKEINFVFSASDTHNMQNVRKTTEQSIEELKEIHSFSKESGMKLNVTVATSFGCPFEGEIPESRVLSCLKELEPLQIHTVTLADTTGMANPKQVSELMSKVVSEFPQLDLGLHFHNTRGMGLANILAGIEAGVTRFDAALGGLGGCPFAPGATGNVCTEDVVHMLHSMGMETNADLSALLEASASLEKLIGHPNKSYILKAGPYDRKYPVPELSN
ncbi:hydroxymethylglutaryl-CoA lyase [Planococcus salinus]|uniref:Hydroxymethylglutaryl-CoA lyase n=1 Tax=Planococcus salinus TaxID=1848460 RepID=A0A3M8P5G5_9BACL|nr:hydroxymethylglutaryl-CoA lyase [Planococcus salinus]RNF38919.1 hydroxymethylglutaryl-CoA lyase [Planococcus salinus]